MRKFNIEKDTTIIIHPTSLPTYSCIEFWMVEVGRNVWVSPIFGALFTKTSDGFEFRVPRVKEERAMSSDQYIERRLNKEEQKLVSSILRWINNK